MIRGSIYTITTSSGGFVSHLPSLLQVVLLSFLANGERDEAWDQYAAIRFPESYEEAITSVREHFSDYLINTPGEDAVDIYTPMRKNRNEWIWAKSDKKNWDLVVDQRRPTKHALKVRERRSGEGIWARHL